MATATIAGSTVTFSNSRGSGKYQRRPAVKMVAAHSRLMCWPRVSGGNKTTLYSIDDWDVPATTIRSW